MSNKGNRGGLSRLLGMAARAVEQATNDRDHRRPNQAGGTDEGWQGMVRKVAGAVGGSSADNHGAEKGHPSPAPAAHPETRPALSNADRAAIARYDYLLQTADPHQIERIHQEAFDRLTPAQRAEVHACMRAELPVAEQPATADPASLARAGTRAEAIRPGFLRGLLARPGRQSGRGGIAGAGLAGAGIGAAGGVLAAVAGGAMVSTVAGPLLEQAASVGVDFEALAGSVDLEGITGSVGDAIGGAGETVSGLSEQAGGLGERLINTELPNLGDIFGQ